jgi:Flp pilus assembly protein TadD
MDLDQNGLAVVCVTREGIFRGRIRAHAGNAAGAGASSAQAAAGRAAEFVHLTSVTILDHQYRVLRRAGEASVNRAHVVYYMADDVTPHMDRIRALVAAEDVDAAQVEVERLLTVAGADGEVLYLAGVVHHHAGNEERARELLARALDATLDGNLRSVIQRHIER